jgi:hypothetical protein
MTIGDRVDDAIEAAQTAVEELRTELEPKLAELGAQARTKIDAVSAKIDEIQAAWAARGSE